jgi:hypothetical protein
MKMAIGLTKFALKTMIFGTRPNEKVDKLW